MPEPLKGKIGHTCMIDYDKRANGHKVVTMREVASAVEFYKRYRGLVGYERLVKECPELNKEWSEYTYSIKKPFSLTTHIHIYNNWLFNLSFHDVIKKEGEE